MEKLFFVALIIGITSTLALSQAPGKMSYQAVVRNNQGDLVANQNVTVRIQILKDSEFGAANYVEVHQQATNENGLVTLVIGEGAVISGDIASIEWDAGPYFIKVEIDPSGGTNYVISGTSQLLSVPYALYAESAGDQSTIWQEEIGTGNIFFDLGKVGIGTHEPQMALHIGPMPDTENGLLIQDFAGDEFSYDKPSIPSLDSTLESVLFYHPESGAFRAMVYDPSFGWDINDVGFGSTAFGYVNSVTGAFSSTFGKFNLVTGNYATAFGFGNNVSGSTSSSFGFENQVAGGLSNAFGQGNNVSAWVGTAFGQSNNVTGNFAFSSGLGLVATSYGESALGVYNSNIPAMGVDYFEPFDRVFSVGIGQSSGSRKDAINIFKDGSVVIGQQYPYFASDIFDVTAKFTLRGNDMALLNESGNLYARIRSLNSTNGNGLLETFYGNGVVATRISGAGLYHFSENFQVKTYISEIGASGYMETIGSNGVFNVLITTLAANTLNGYVAVGNSVGQTKAGIYVNTSNQGIVFGDVKSFKMDNPLDENTSIVYACLEGPEAGAYERGSASLSNGEAFVSYSEHYQIVVNPETVTVHLTPHSADTYGLAVIEKTPTGFWVKELKGGNGSFSFDWKVEGKRKGYENHNPIQPNENFEHSKASPQEIPNIRPSIQED